MAPASGTVRSIHPMCPGGGMPSSAIGLFLRTFRRGRRRLVRAALHHDVELRHQRGNCAESSQDWGEYDTGRRHRQRNLHKCVTLLILDNDAPYVAFVYELGDLIGEVSAMNFELLEELAEFVHEGSVTRDG